jgi:hypothetical protein
MSRTFLCAVLATCAIPAHGETWHFAYQGFHDSVAGIFLPDRTLAGSFTGLDGDGDGAIGRAEVTALFVNGVDFIGCESHSNAYYHCGTDAFAYRDGSLSFSAGQYGSDPEGWVGGGHFYVTGDREYRYAFRPNQFDEWEYRWTPQTTFAISPAPEPGTWALLLAGLPMAALAVWRQQRR